MTCIVCTVLFLLGVVNSRLVCFCYVLKLFLFNEDLFTEQINHFVGMQSVYSLSRFRIVCGIHGACTLMCLTLISDNNVILCSVLGPVYMEVGDPR